MPEPQEPKKTPIIGLDFGNYNSFMCFISDLKEETKIGGIVHDLMPNGWDYGIPSVYFFSEDRGEHYGEDAIRFGPIENRLRYLKRHIGKDFILDSSLPIEYEHAITKVIQHCVRRANERLQTEFLCITNLISLSYPATYTFAQRQRLIEAAEKATLEFDEDGEKKMKNIKVVGTIAEPAAAALDYLAEAGITENKTVLVYDLGGGTFDLALVAAYPEGRYDNDGNIYYYDIVNARGVANIGGVEFDKRIFTLLEKQVKEQVKNVTLNNRQLSELMERAEEFKKELSSNEKWEIDWPFNGDYIHLKVSRDKFKEASTDLLKKTVDETKKILADYPDQQPDCIVLTGGASQMPMVKRALEVKLPEFSGKIQCFKPERAIAHGAARYGTSEVNTDLHPVQQRTMYDLGIRFYRRKDSEDLFIDTLIPAGTAIPCVSKETYSYTRSEGQYSYKGVCEAKTAKPDINKPDEDYVEIMSVKTDFGRSVPKDTESVSRLLIDKNNLLTVETRENKSGKPWFKNQVELKNLS